LPLSIVFEDDADFVKIMKLSDGMKQIEDPIDQVKILFLSANPVGTTVLRLDEEKRSIKQKIRAAEYRDQFQFEIADAARPDDLLQAMNEHRPTIVHFSGHGSNAGEIILSDNQGNPKPVSKDALVALFESTAKNVQIVVLNSCFSRPQAEAIVSVVPCAVGMKDMVSDEGAAVFSASFYRALAFGFSVKDAFLQGVAALKLEGIAEGDIPELLTRSNVEAKNIYLVKAQKPNEQQTLPKITTGSKPEPNIVILGKPRLTPLTHNAEFIFSEELRAINDGRWGIVIEFQNRKVGDEIKSLEGVRSELTFSNKSGTLSHTINPGFWLGPNNTEVSFERGDIHRLFVGYLGRLAGTHQAYISTIDRRFTPPEPVTFSPQDSINVRITLFTQTRHRFHEECELELTPELRVTKPLGETGLNPFPSLFSVQSADIQGEIKEVFYEKDVSMDASFILSKDVYYDYIFTVRVYVSNQGSPTSVERFNFKLCVNDQELIGERLSLKDFHIFRIGTGQDKLIDIEEANDAPFEHTRNGWLRFLVRNVKAVGDYHEEPKQVINMALIDKRKKTHTLAGLPQEQWKKTSWQYPERIVHDKQHF
jgi:hypothetical protein